MDDSTRPKMRYGFWMPVFGGWLRNVEDEAMAATWDPELAQQVGQAIGQEVKEFLATIPQHPFQTRRCTSL